MYITDFIIDYGSNSIINEISSDFFLRNFIHILSPQYNCNKEIKKLTIFLLRKWSQKKKEFINFEKYYNKLANDMKQLQKIIFPFSIYNIMTYLKYISEYEIEEIYKNLKNKSDIKNPNREKTVYQNPFSESIEKKNSNSIDNINNKKNYFYINQSDAPPQIPQSNLNDKNNKINMKQNIPNNKENIIIYDSNFYNTIYLEKDENNKKNNNIDINMGCPSISYKAPINNKNLCNVDNTTKKQKNEGVDSLNNNLNINEKQKIYISPGGAGDNVNNKNVNQKIYMFPNEPTNKINNINVKKKIYVSPNESTNKNTNINVKKKIYVSPNESTNIINNIKENKKIYVSPNESTNIINNIPEKDDNNIKNQDNYLSKKESIKIIKNNVKPKIYSSPEEPKNNFIQKSKVETQQQNNIEKISNKSNNNKYNNIGNVNIGGNINITNNGNNNNKQEQNDKIPKNEIQNNINKIYQKYNYLLKEDKINESSNLINSIYQ